MDCTKYKDWLSAATLDALDAGQRAEWQAHLESCGDCRAELDRRRLFLAAMDQAVARTAEGELSPAFAARVRQRIEEQAPAANWFAGWLPATAGALAVLALVVWMWNRQPAQPVPDSRPPVVAEKSPVQVPPAQEAAPETVPQPVKIRAVRTRPVPARKETPRVPEVLVPANERGGLQMLLAAVQKRHDAVAQIFDPDKARQQSSPLKLDDLDVQRLEIPELGSESKDSSSEKSIR